MERKMTDCDSVGSRGRWFYVYDSKKRPQENKSSKPPTSKRDENREPHVFHIHLNASNSIGKVHCFNYGIILSASLIVIPDWK